MLCGHFGFPSNCSLTHFFVLHPGQNICFCFYVLWMACLFAYFENLDDCTRFSCEFMIVQVAMEFHLKVNTFLLNHINRLSLSVYFSSQPSLL